MVHQKTHGLLVASEGVGARAKGLGGEVGKSGVVSGPYGGRALRCNGEAEVFREGCGRLCQGSMAYCEVKVVEVGLSTAV